MVVNRKICQLDRLLSERESARSHGKKVVHCHGCFDIVHPGHIHHLQFAKSQGDILIVTVSADPSVNKGVNRPLIPDDLRAASLAALECVDWVHVNDEPTAVNLLEKLKPDIYIKGREYETNNDPRFLAEKNAVIANGGRVVFSSGDVIYSSTALIGQLEDRDVFDREKVRRFQDRFELTPPHLHELGARFRNLRVAVVGDYILDRYHFCDATGIAGEAPMMSLRSLATHEYDGGAAIIASHIARLGASATLITALADDAISEEIQNRLTSAGIDVQSAPQRRQIVSKHRYLVDQAKLFKVDDGAVHPLDSQDESSFADRILRAATGADAVIFVDFGYGLLTAPLLQRIMPTLRKTVPILTADVSGVRSNLLRFHYVDLICPTERELRQTLNDFSAGLTSVVYRLMAETRAKQMLVTLGKEGLVAFDQFLPPTPEQSWERQLRAAYLPSLASHAIDPLGCGDALLAAATLTLAAGGSVHAAAYLGSIAAAVEAGQIGNHAVSAEQLLSRIHQYQPKSLAA
jgi:rfaE bifunctional protein kinase chain/domain/rfaE bifunctional protein nucleotidyltransferase chain/domain